MTFIKKHFRAALFVFGLFGLNTYFWLSRLERAYLNFDIVLTSLLGSFVLIALMMTFLLSTRQRHIVKWFGGLDILYVWHRWIAMLSLGIIFLHQTYATDEGLRILERYLVLGIDPEDLGELARNGFILLIGLALVAKWMKYEHFKFLHKFMVVPYFLGLYHGFASSWVDLFAFDALSIFMITTSVIGLGSSLYMLVFYQHVAFRYTGSVAEVTHLNASMIDIKIKVNKPYKFKPGQFCFIRFNNHQLSKHPHPFSISGSDEDYIYFTIKNLGDFTEKLYKKLTPHTLVHLSKPFGHMTYEIEEKKHVWVAGGVGVTPFLSYIRSGLYANKPITLYYAVRNLDEAIHLDTFRAYEQSHPNFTFVLFNAQTQGYISAKDLGLSYETHVSMCGPKPMVDALRKGIKKIDKSIPITYEAFSFTGNLVSDLLNYLRRFFKLLKPKKKVSQ